VTLFVNFDVVYVTYFVCEFIDKACMYSSYKSWDLGYSSFVHTSHSSLTDSLRKL